MKKTIVAALTILITLASYTFAQTPTPTVYPPMPDSRFGGIPAEPGVGMVAKDDVLFYRYGTNTKLFYIGSNDENSGEIYLTSRSQNVGNMYESSSYYGSSSSQRQVLAYGDFATQNGTPQIGGVDIGTYFTATTYINIPKVFYSNVANIAILVIPGDGAEDAGDTCPGFLGKSGLPSLPGQKIGKPINPMTGNMWVEHSDYSLPGIGESINVNRFYNTVIQTNGLFGKGWRSPYDESLVAYGDLMVRINMPNGQAVYLARRDTNSPFNLSPQGYIGEVIKNTDGSYNLNFKDGRSHKFAPSGKLLWQKDRNGNQTTILYAANGALTGVVDPFGRTLNILVINGLVTQIGDSVGIIADYSYNPDGTLQTVTYADNSQYKYTYTTINGKTYMTTVKDALDNVLEAHQYDGDGKATVSEKHGGVEKYTVDYTGNYNYYWNPFTQVTDALGRTTTYNYNVNDSGQKSVFSIQGNCNCGGNAQSIKYEYNEKRYVTKSTDALNRITTFTYDDKGNVLTKTDAAGTESYTYNQFGERLTTTDRMGGVTTNTYDAQGKLLTTQNALGQTTTFAYTTAGQIATVTDARNKTTSFYYDALGRPGQITDANGKNTNYVYDVRSRLTQTTNALGQTTNLQYDAANRLNKIIYPDTKFNSYTYDLAGRKITSTDERGNTTTYGYDNAYRVIAVTDALNHTLQFGYDLMSNMTATVDALGNVTNYEYDNFDRLVKRVYPAESANAARLFETHEYDAVGNLKKRLDTAGRQTLYDYDALNRLISVTNADNKTTYHEYNARSQRTKVTDALNQQYVFTYDALGRVTSETRGGSTAGYQYDQVGNLVNRTDRNGVTTNYVYDNLNRLQTVQYPNSAENVGYTYDDLSRMQSATNYAGTVSFTYDNRGRLTSTTDVHGRAVSYTYDETGNRTQMKLDGVMHTLYAYDQANRLTQMTGEQNEVYSFAYDAANRMTTKTLPLNIVTTYDYDGMSRLRRQKDDIGAGVIFDKQYNYNQANQIAQIIEPTKTKNYFYDNLDRLTQVVDPASPATALESYGYDAVGNRTASHLSTGYTYQPFNRLTATQNAGYVYDSNGNRISKSDASGMTQYVWDYENRLRQVVKPNAQPLTFEYDALGRRTKRYATKITYDGQEVILDDNNGSLKYQNGPGTDHKLKGIFGNTNPIYVISDHLGSGRGLIYAPGYGTNGTTYDSFGTPSDGSGPRFKYTGREYEQQTDLYYYRARWYDSQLGRFISEDPIGFKGGDINLYAYVNNNSVNRKDPSGLIDPAVYQDPRMYNYGISPRKAACELDGYNLWLTGEGGGALQFGPLGGGDSIVVALNPMTLELCVYTKVVSGMGGATGILATADAQFGFSFGSAEGTTAGGHTAELFGDATAFGGGSGSISVLGGLGAGMGAGPSIGGGAAAGLRVGEMTLWFCLNKNKCDCQK